MRIALIGQQAFGETVLEAFLARGDEVAGVFCAPEKPGRSQDPLHAAALAKGLPVFQFESLKDAAAHEALGGLDADLGVMAFVLQFAPQEFVRLPRHGTIQYHPSLLPAYRGPSAINWAIIRGERSTGLTIFRPTDGLDEGAVILQKEVAIGPDDTTGSLYFDKLFPLGVEATLEAADLVVAGGHTETPQDESLATYEGWCGAAAVEINWHRHVDHVYDTIRGANPAPGAWTRHDGAKLQIFDARKHAFRAFREVTGKPGEVVAITDTSVTVAATGGQIEILRVRAEGGSKTPAGDFARAASLQVGTRLGDA